MRVVVIGGTRFIGRATVEHLLASGDDVLVVHRGQAEPDGWEGVQHLHVERAKLPDVRDELAAFKADAILDSIPLTRRDAEIALDAFPEGPRIVLFSSVDVYRAYSSLLAGTESDPVPLTEASPVREQRYPYRGQGTGLDDYEKLDVEETYLARGATVLRLPMVHGPHDRQRREEFILRRVRAGRRRIPFGAGTWLTCRSFVGDVAKATRLALANTSVAGEIFNIAETSTATMRLWAEQILQVANFEAELVRVPDDALPDDLKYTGTVSQHLQADASKARAVLGWQPGDRLEGLRASVQWHLANPPTEPDPDFSPDDRALELSTRTA